MPLMKIIMMTLLSGALVLGGAAGAKTSKSKDKAAKTPAALVCPVTGEKIASKAKAAGSSTYKGKTYYFCCASCKPAFDKDPAKYVKKSASKPGKPA